MKLLRLALLGACLASLGAISISDSAEAQIRGKNEFHTRVLQRRYERLATVIGPTEAMRLMNQPRIVGGSNAPDLYYKFQVALLSASEPSDWNAQFCGGTLIAARFVVTAAHCVDFITNPSQIQVLVGTQVLSTTTTSNGTRINVTNITIRSDWDPGTFDNDAAVLELETPTSGIPFATLLSRTDEATLAPTRGRTWVSGWGQTESAPAFPTELQHVAIRFIGRITCNKPASYNGDITLRMTCAGVMAGGKDSCQGDSGGPLVVNNANGARRTLAGIVSWGIGCAEPNLPGIYTRVPVFRTWILSIVNAG